VNRPAALARAVLSGLFITALLAGCGSQQAGAAGAATSKLQERARTVTRLVSEQDPSAALAELEGLSADLAAAAAQGQLSAEQQRRAEQALGSVRTDLQSMVAAPADAPATGQPAAPEGASGGASGDDEGQDGQDCDDDEGAGADNGGNGGQESRHSQEDHGDRHGRHHGDEDDDEDDD
jgi:hypothetical protein